MEQKMNGGYLEFIHAYDDFFMIKFQDQGNKRLNQTFR